MKTLLLTAVLVLGSTSVFAGNCNFSTDRASDGSVCGDRAADKREGGN